MVDTLADTKVEAKAKTTANNMGSMQVEDTLPERAVKSKASTIANTIKGGNAESFV